MPKSPLAVSDGLWTTTPPAAWSRLVVLATGKADDNEQQSSQVFSHLAFLLISWIRIAAARCLTTRRMLPPECRFDEECQEGARRAERTLRRAAQRENENLAGQCPSLPQQFQCQLDHARGVTKAVDHPKASS